MIQASPPGKRHGMTLLQAVSLNMGMMVGVGPFITIPAFVATLGGPHAMIGWVLGAIVALADGLVWSELAAAFPGSGGTYHFYDAVYGEARSGRLLKFLFVWQFLLSGPLELASGAIGLSLYASYLAPALSGAAWDLSIAVPTLGTLGWRVAWSQVFAMGVMVAVTGLAYRRIELAARLMVVLWAGMLATVAWVIVAGLTHFEPARAFGVPAGAWTLDQTFLMGLGAAVAIAMYDFLGYYQICYMGDEVADAPRTIPRAILISVVAVATIYLIMNVSILGVIPWREVVASDHIATDLMARLYGSSAATFVTLMIVWTALASVFSALLGYSRVPYAAARSGHFFRGLARTHPTGDFPHRSLLLMGALATLACLASLETVIGALLTARIPIQFIGQIATVFYLRTRPELRERMRFRMWLFPVPALVALVGWLFVFGTSKPLILAYGALSLLVGLVVFAAWDRLRPAVT